MTSGFCDPQAPAHWLDRLRADLASPPLALEIAELHDLWQVETVRFLCRRPPLLEDYPELSVRMRGAFGRRLAEQGARGGSRPRDHVPAFQILFSPMGELPNGDEIPKPVIVRAAIEGERLVVDVSLLGIAALWLDDAADAMAAALEGGIALRQGGRQRVPIVVEDMLVTRWARAPAPERASSAVLTFRSPVTVRRGRTLAEGAEALIRSMPRRISALSVWQCATLRADEPGLRHAIGTLRFDERLLASHRWQRHSIRSGDAAIPMAGHVGRLELSGSLVPLVPYLLLAETCNIGSHTALGLGWFDLALFP